MKTNGKNGHGNLAQLLADDFARSGLTSADLEKLAVRPITAADIAKLPNAPAGPHAAGARIPYFDLAGEPLKVEDSEKGDPVLMYRVRYYWNGNGFGKLAGIRPQRYTQPLRVGCPPYFPPHPKKTKWAEVARDSKREVWITEGEKKAACATKHGQPTVGLGGVWNFKGKDRPLHDLFYELGLEGRSVVLVQDSDWLTNHNVRYAGDALARVLTGEGATVSVLRLPALPGLEKTGLDDYLVKAGTPADALTALREEIRPWRDGTYNDTGLAARFSELAKGKLFYSIGIKPSHNHWRWWTGKVWEVNYEKAISLSASIPAQLASEADSLKDERARGRARAWAVQSGNIGRRKAALELASAEMSKSFEELDTDPYLFNLQNGVLNLKTFKLQAHDPALMQGRISPARYDPRARAPEFQTFIHRILPNKNVRNFIQRLAGYFLFGGNPERVFVNWWGGGRNGKTVLKELMQYAGGDYAKTCPSDTFLVGRRTGAVRDDLNRLRGARLALAVEPKRMSDLDEATVKEVVGGDTISTRGLWGEYADWRPVFTPLLVSNHRLMVRGTDDGIWDRLVIVPFSVRIPEDDVDPHYRENKLQPEVDGYLQWALEGLKAYWSDGLQIPDEVRNVGKEHRQDSDVVQLFLDDHCSRNPKAAAKDCVGAEQLKTAFTDYCARQGLPKSTAAGLKDRMEQLQFKVRRGHERRYWEGLQMKMPKNYLAVAAGGGNG